VAASLFAAAAGAQTPGTLEVGGYGQYTIFDDRAGRPTSSGEGFENKIGVGGRVGVFFTPRFSLEGEGSYTKLEAGSTLPGLNEDNDHYSPLALRVNYNFPFATNSAFILGGGVTRSDYGTVFHYGPSGLVGARIGLGRVLALRVDGVYNYLPDDAAKVDEFYLRAGLSAMIPGSTPMTAEQQAQMGGAPQPGTVEVGGFGQYSFFDGDLNLKNALGVGARLGVFVTPIIQPEVDFSYTESDQDQGSVSNLHVVPVAARLNFNFPFGARNAFILGGGASRTFYQQQGSPYYGGVDDENNVGGAYNWGVSGLAGVRVGLGQRVAVRLDGVGDYLPEPKFANFGVRAGLSLMLGGARPAEPAEPPPAPVDTTTPVPVDTTPVAPPPPDTAGQGYREAQDAARAALTSVIYFDFDRSNIRQDAASVLDAKIPIMQANTEMRIRITGNTDTRGSDEYNLALGQRRAAAARRYLTQRGIDASRIEVASRGEENPVAANATTEDEHQQNRRDEFEIVVGGENIMVPGMTPPAMTSPSAAPAPAMTDSSSMMRDSTMTDTTMTRDTTSTTTPPSNSLNSTTAPALEPTTTPTDSAAVAPAAPVDSTTTTPSTTTAPMTPAAPADSTTTTPPATPAAPGTPPTDSTTAPTTPPSTTPPVR
jgi:peptidoglycan-associated lipoprotein